MKLSFFKLLLFFQLSLLAKDFEVVSINGLVKTSPRLRSKQMNVKLGDKLLPQQYYYTGRFSSMRFKFPDNSVVILGPRTVMRVDQIESSQHVVLTLLQGMTRVTMVPAGEKKEDRKFFLKTESILVEPRESDLIVFHDQTTDYSSVLGMQGEVSLYYNKNLSGQDIQAEEIEVEREELDGNVEDIKIQPFKLSSKSRELSKLVKDKEGLKVQKGQVSYTLKSLETLSQPVKISKVQYNLLFKNSDLSIKRDKKVTIYNKETAKGINVPLTPAEQSVPPEGLLDKSKKLYAAKSGGFIDLKTGLYIPPSSRAIYLASVDSYLDESIGSLDIETGQFKAVLGLELDNRAGFVQKRIKEGAPKNFLKKIENNQKKMNALLDLGIINGAKDPFKKASEQYSKYSNRELFSKNNLILSLTFFSEEMTLENSNFTTPRSSYDSDSARHYRIMWEQKSSRLWQPFFGVGISEYEIEKNQLGSLTQAGDSLSFLTAGVKYSLSSRWNTGAHLMFDQKYVFNPSNSSGAQEISQVALPKIGVSIDGALIQSGRFSLENSLLLTMSLSKEAGDLKVGQGFGLSYELDGRYWIKRDLWGSFGAFYRSESYDITNSGNTADIKYKSSGIIFKVGYVFDDL